MCAGWSNAHLGRCAGEWSLFFGDGGCARVNQSSIFEPENFKFYIPNEYVKIVSIKRRKGRTQRVHWFGKILPRKTNKVSLECRIALHVIVRFKIIQISLLEFLCTSYPSTFSPSNVSRAPVPEASHFVHIIGPHRAVGLLSQLHPPNERAPSASLANCAPFFLCNLDKESRPPPTMLCLSKPDPGQMRGTGTSHWWQQPFHMPPCLLKKIPPSQSSCPQSQEKTPILFLRMSEVCLGPRGRGVGPPFLRRHRRRPRLLPIAARRRPADLWFAPLPAISSKGTLHAHIVPSRNRFFLGTE